MSNVGDNIADLGELRGLKEVLNTLKAECKIPIAILFGSFASARQHSRSDIDLAVYINPCNEKEQLEIIDKVLMSVDRDVTSSPNF